jgi:hypothetical protein
MEVELRFTIEVSPAEWRALRYVIDGHSNLAVAKYMGLATPVVEKNFSEWKLDLNLVEATRGNLVEWHFVPARNDILNGPARNDVRESERKTA